MPIKKEITEALRESSEEELTEFRLKLSNEITLIEEKMMKFTSEEKYSEVYDGLKGSLETFNEMHDVVVDYCISKINLDE
tara:strand:+ start:32253 stop:32492 length:240 start_codon:yes stop_codon:yes gene_type:complete